MQLIAFFGSVCCFNVGISSGNFDIFDLGCFSIAGGSKEIVNILDQHEICDWLLKMHKCEYNDQPPKLFGPSNSSLQKALGYYNDSVFLFLSKNGYGNISLCNACCYDSVEAVTHLINDKGASVEERDGIESTPLHWASINGNISVVRYFVEACAANIDVKDIEGNTPSQMAEYCFSEEKKKQVREYLEERMKK